MLFRSRIKVAPNLDIESMNIYPHNGYRNDKILWTTKKSKTFSMEPSIFGKLIISSLALIIAGWLFQDQADRYTGKVARFFQKALTVVLILLATVVLAGSVIAVIWINN